MPLELLELFWTRPQASCIFYKLPFSELVEPLVLAILGVWFWPIFRPKNPYYWYTFFFNIPMISPWHYRYDYSYNAIPIVYPSYPPKSAKMGWSKTMRKMVGLWHWIPHHWILTHQKNPNRPKFATWLSWPMAGGHLVSLLPAADVALDGDMRPGNKRNRRDFYRWTMRYHEKNRLSMGIFGMILHQAMEIMEDKNGIDIYWFIHQQLGLLYGIFSCWLVLHSPKMLLQGGATVKLRFSTGKLGFSSLTYSMLYH